MRKIHESTRVVSSKRRERKGSLKKPRSEKRRGGKKGKGVEKCDNGKNSFIPSPPPIPLLIPSSKKLAGGDPLPLSRRESEQPREGK